MKVLFVLTSHSELGTQEKNRIFEEFAAPYYELADKGVVDIATPLGGQPPLIKSDDPSAATEDTKRFDKDTALQAKLRNT
jgi:hypothetical protein